MFPKNRICIAPAAQSVIVSLPSDLREKVKNALREISQNSEAGTTLRSPASAQLYRAGRFQIVYRRRNGTVWVDALALDAVSAGLHGAGGKRS